MVTMENTYLMLHYFQYKKSRTTTVKPHKCKYPKQTWFDRWFGYKKTYVTFNDVESVHILSQLGSRDSVYSVFRLSE